MTASISSLIDALDRLDAPGALTASDATSSRDNPDNPEPAEKYTVPALERGLRILEEFGRGSRTLGAPELARRLGLPRSTVFRLLNTLEGLRFIERAPGGSDYCLGMGVLRLGYEYLSSLELTDISQPLLTQLCDAVRHSCNLAVRDGRSIVYVAKVTPPTFFTSALRVGTRLPVHGTVFGRILLADFSLPELGALYPEERLEVFSEHTPRSVMDLFNLIVADRVRGYALGVGYCDRSTSSIVAPVRDHTGRVAAALGLTTPNGMLTTAQLDTLALTVRASAEELSRRLNYRPGSATVHALHPA
jgi:DNA-binding IclR family transcriptional regulator